MKGDPILVQAAQRRVRSESLRTRVYWELRGRIQRGEVGPHDRLVDQEIARELEVSRMPVREALLQLVNEGYVVGTTRGFTLPRLTRSDVADIFEVRRLIEPRAAGSAAVGLTDEGLGRLADAVRKAETAVASRDVTGLTLANIQFRETWIAAIGNPRLAEIIGRFADQVQVVRLNTLARPESQRIVIRGLRRLLTAFQRRNALAVFDHMTAFVAEAEEHFFASLEEQDRS
jgi:DNA-binding GntR family transcriptional regulator